MSYYVDIGEQDTALAEQIARDQSTLAALHETVLAVRDRQTSCGSRPAAAQEGAGRPAGRPQVAQAQLKELEKETKRALAAQKSAYDRLAATRQRLPRLWPRARPRSASSRRRSEISPSRSACGTSVPVQRDAHLAAGRRDQPGVRLHRLLHGARRRKLRALPQGHRHRSAEVHADPGVGRRHGPLAGPNPYDPYPKAWIVIIAHSRT